MDISTVWVFFAVFLAAFVRSFAGFGFALLLVPALLMNLSPQVVVPLIILLDLPISLILWPKIRNDVDWGSLKWILPLALVGVLPGLLILEKLPAAPLKIAIAIFALLFTLVLASGFRLKKQPNVFISSLAGALSGFLGASTGMAGPPIIFFYFVSPKENAESRASLMAYFLILGIFTLILLFFRNQISIEILNLWIKMVPMVFIGTWLGNKMYSKVSPDSFRKFIFLLLTLIASSTLLRELFG